MDSDLKILDFEKQAILALCSYDIPNSILIDAIHKPSSISCKFYGAGYELTFSHKSLPKENASFENPNIFFRFQGSKLNVSVHISENQLCLDVFDSNGVPSDIRSGSVDLVVT